MEQTLSLHLQQSTKTNHEYRAAIVSQSELFADLAVEQVNEWNATCGIAQSTRLIPVRVAIAESTIDDAALQSCDMIVAALFTDVSATNVSGSSTVQHVQRLLEVARPTGLYLFPGQLDLGRIRREEQVELDAWQSSLCGRADVRFYGAAHLDKKYLNPDLQAGLRNLVNQVVAKQLASMPGSEVGPLGFRVGYTEDGDKVEFLPDYGSPMGEVCLIRRSDATVREALATYEDLARWIYHDHWAHRVNSGQVVLSAQERALFELSVQRAEQILYKYGEDSVGGDDYELGLRQGRLAALAWVLGAQWQEQERASASGGMGARSLTLRPRRYAPYNSPSNGQIEYAKE